MNVCRSLACRVPTGGLFHSMRSISFFPAELGPCLRPSIADRDMLNTSLHSIIERVSSLAARSSCRCTGLMNIRPNVLMLTRYSYNIQPRRQQLHSLSSRHTRLERSRVHNQTPVFSYNYFLPCTGRTDVQRFQIRFNRSKPGVIWSGHCT